MSDQDIEQAATSELDRTLNLADSPKVENAGGVGEPPSPSNACCHGGGESRNSENLGDAVVELRHEAFNAGTAGAVIALAFSLIGLVPTEFGRKVAFLVSEFVTHVLGGVDVAAYGLVAVVGGVALIANGTKLAVFLRDRVFKPLLSVLFHACGLALGTTAALVLSCVWSAAYRPQILSMLGAAFFIAILMLETAMGLLSATLKPKDLGWNKVVRLALRLLGIAVVVLGCLAFKKAIDLTKEPHPAVTCPPASKSTSTAVSPSH